MNSSVIYSSHHRLPHTFIHSRNTNPHPRGTLVAGLLKNIDTKKNEVRQELYVDRGIGTILDTYSSEEQENLADYW